MTTDTPIRPPAPAGFDPFSQDFLADPHAFWQDAREHPAFFYEPLRCWVLTGHADVTNAFKNWQTFSSRVLRVAPLPEDTRVPAQTREILTELMAHAIINMDPPEHTVHRKSTQKAFTRPLVAASEPMIRQLANELIDDFADRGECDLVSDYFHKLTIGVIVRMAAMPEEILPRFRGWIDDLQGLMTLQQFNDDDEPTQLPAPIEVLEERYVRVAEAYPLFKAYLDDRRANPRDDLASAMLQATNDDGTPAMSYDHILGHIVGLAVAGSETTTGLMGQLVRLFGARPELLDQIGADPDLWDNAVEEGLRRLAVVNNLLRVTTTEVEVAGVTIPARSPVLLNVAGANSDASVFDDPLAFDLHRVNRDDHLGFGLGRHFCSGAPLARLEARCALEELYRRLPDLRVVADQPLEYKPAVTVRGLKRLLARWAL
jgi:cytochrome P450